MTKFIPIETLYPNLLHYLTAYKVSTFLFLKFEEVLRLLLVEADSGGGVIGLAIFLPLYLVDALDFVKDYCFDGVAYDL
nr:hypothetical protein [Tanacetum cinerariifolium]